MADEKEATIIINGIELNFAQSMAVRVALEHYRWKLNEDPTSLGSDNTGMAIAKNYKNRLTEVINIIFKGVR